MADEVSALSQFHQTAIYISFVVINNWLSLKLLIKIKSTNKLMAFQIKIKLLKKKNYNEKIDWKYKNKNFLILFDFLCLLAFVLVRLALNLFYFNNAIILKILLLKKFFIFFY